MVRGRSARRKAERGRRLKTPYGRHEARLRVPLALWRSPLRALRETPQPAEPMTAP